MKDKYSKYILVTMLIVFGPFIVMQTVNIRSRYYNNIRQCDQFAGSDPGAKINACITDLPNSGGVADARSITGASNIITTQITISKPVHLLLGGNFQYTGATMANGLIYINGGTVGGTKSFGTVIECVNGTPQNITFAEINTVSPCGITYTPSSGTPGPVIVTDELNSTHSINNVEFKNLSIVVNSLVSDVFLHRAYGGGTAGIEYNKISIINSSVTTGWTGAGIALRCLNAGAAANAQYAINLYDVGIYSNGSAVNGGMGGTTSSGVLLDPTGMSGCGFVGPSIIRNLWEEGLTGTFGLYIKAAEGIVIEDPVINSNNFANGADVIHVENGAYTSGTIIISPQMADNDWSANGGVKDISFPSGAGLTILGGEFSGGSAGTTHAEDHAIDIGGATANINIEGPTITNLKTFGTALNAGALNVKYCAYFTVGNGAATEFNNSLATLSNAGCATFSPGNDNLFRMVNRSFGTRAWDFDADVNGFWKLNMNATPRITVNPTAGSVTFVDSPVIPFNAATAANIPLSMSITGTQDTGTVHLVHGVGQLVSGTPSTVTITLSGNAVYAGATLYHCTVTDTDAVQTLQVANTSGTQFVVTGPNTNTNHFNFICIGT